MPKSPGTRVGPYEILAPLGVGGMGEVYRARDTKLNRDVAIKFLLASVVIDPDRLARFSREAQVLASLNHPNIAHVHGLEDAAGEQALVMELVDGPTLADRIAQGPIPLAEALPIAKQIAEALEAAHERGIVHRDLKPANIKVRDDGTVKVLDFGLAKAMGAEGGGASTESAMNSPTLSIHATQAGLILGTAAYMSPEQASGKAIDKRSDLWAFGVVLLEMLTGRQTFDGETVSHVLAAVLTKEPDWTGVPSNTPAPVRRLLRRCLEKDRKRRLDSAADARLDVEEAIAAPSIEIVRSGGGGHRKLPWAFAALATAAAVGMAALYFLQRDAVKPEVVRFEVSEPEGTSFGAQIALSPDGRIVVFAATGPGDGRTRLWLRRLDSLDAHPLAGTERVVGSAFWSPDSRFLFFASGGKLRKIDVQGGPAQPICDLKSTPGGGFVTAEGNIVFGTPATAGIQQCPGGGGAATSITAFKAGGQEAWHAFPVLLPDGKHFLFWRAAGPDSGIYVGSLEATPDEQTGRRVLPDSSAPLYIPGSDGGQGRLLFVRERTLMAQAFDAKALAVSGVPVPVATGVLTVYATASSANGTLVYLTDANEQAQVTWLDRAGRTLATVGEPGLPFLDMRLSSDGTRFAAARVDPGARSDIWVVDSARGSEMRLTTDAAGDQTPVWSPDGDRLVFASDREGTGNLYVRSASGAGADVLLFRSDERKVPVDWSANGFLMFISFTPGGPALWVLPMDAAAAHNRKALPYLGSDFNASAARFSPDGRFVAYQSNISGAAEVYVRPFDPAAPDGSRSAAVKISQGGGTAPRWRADGKELFFQSARTQMAVDTTLGPSFRSGTPQKLFAMPENALGTNVSSDGQRFLFRVPVGASRSALAVVVNWR